VARLLLIKNRFKTWVRGFNRKAVITNHKCVGAFSGSRVTPGPISGWMRLGMGSPWVREVNANPCLSPDARFVAAAERADLTFNNVIETIIGDSQSCRKVRDER
jgi:hypothetical protein